jgi:hypothetical protein
MTCIGFPRKHICVKSKDLSLDLSDTNRPVTLLYKRPYNNSVKFTLHTNLQSPPPRPPKGDLILVNGYK